MKASDNLSPKTTEKTKSVTFRDTTENENLNVQSLMCSIELRKFEKSPKNENKTKQTKKTSESKILHI